MTVRDYGPRPRAGAAYFKAHGLGNDYLVFEEGDAWTLTDAAVQRVCHRWRGVGSDGIVLLLRDRGQGTFRLRMFNPDGSEFERSGNGLRILASHLARAGAVDTHPFTVLVGGDHVTMTVHGRSGARFDVSVDMGRAQVGAEAVGLDPSALLAQQHMEGPEGMPVRVVPVSVGNPHLVVLTDAVSQEALHRLGPFLETHPALEAGANVQLAAPAGSDAMRALIWERGVGPTAASGTSSCAVAVAAVTAGLVTPGSVRVIMDGGELTARVGEELDVVLRGPVEEVCTGELTPEAVRGLEEGGPGLGGVEVVGDSE